MVHLIYYAIRKLNIVACCLSIVFVLSLMIQLEVRSAISRDRRT